LSHRKDTDYLAISARIRALENRMLTGEKLERLIEAGDTGQARKLLAQSGYSDSGTLEEVLTQARGELFRELSAAVPDPGLIQVFQVKYDCHNAKTILKAQAMGVEPNRLLLSGGRYEPAQLLDCWQRESLGSLSPIFRTAMERAWKSLQEERDPQRADLILDRACYEEMGALAGELSSPFLQGYVRLAVDAANLRAAVRAHRMERGGDFLRRVLLPGGNVSSEAIAAARGEGLADVFQGGALAQAAELGAGLTRPGSGALTAFERECDNALTGYLSAARRISFGEETVIGYLYAKEQEFTAIRAVFAGRAAGLDGETIRSRLRETYV